MRLPQREIKRARIEIVPMIDTMAFLLIFFMMASLAMTPMSSLKVSLPKASAGEKANAARVILTMTDRGAIYLNQKPVSLSQVTPLVKERVAANPEVQVIINADKRLRYDRVVALLDAAKRANPKSLQLATAPNPSIK